MRKDVLIQLLMKVVFIIEFLIIVINDLCFEKEMGDCDDDNNNECNEKEIILFLYKVSQNVNMKLKVLIQLTVEEFKGVFRKEGKIK